MKQREFIRYIESQGFVLIKNSKHAIYSNGRVHVAVPYHKEIAVGTIRSILSIVCGSRENANSTMRNLRGKAA